MFLNMSTYLKFMVCSHSPLPGTPWASRERRRFAAEGCAYFYTSPNLAWNYLELRFGVFEGVGPLSWIREVLQGGAPQLAFS